MTGSMYASIAGLRAHMEKLTVIGNNIANVNTQGYKKQRTIFRDSIYRMFSGGSNGSDSIGSKNPSQLGYGSLVASIDLDMSSSSYAPGNELDCALVGEGFFLVSSKETAATIDPYNSDTLKAFTLSRLGDFHFGADGYLVDGQGNVVYGFMCTSDKETYKTADGKTKERQRVSDQLVPIRKPRWEKNKETGGYDIRYARTDVRTDAEGKKLADPVAENVGKNEHDLYKLVDDKPIYHVTGDGADQNVPADYSFAELSSITIDSKTGAISGIAKEGDEPVVIGYLAIGSVTNPNGVSHVDSSYYKCQEGAGEVRINMLGAMQKSLNIANINSYQSHYEIDTNTGEPNYAGTWTEEVEGRELPTGGEVTSAGDTKMMVGFLETSNVDLATEISELITTQRGYQANTRIVTVTDSMLEELVNMKR